MQRYKFIFKFIHTFCIFHKVFSSFFIDIKLTLTFFSTYRHIAQEHIEQPQYQALQAFAQLTDNQQLGNTPCFTLQNMAFQAAKGGILECKRRQIAMQFAAFCKTGDDLPHADYMPRALYMRSFASFISWNFFSAARRMSSPRAATRSG